MRLSVRFLLFFDSIFFFWTLSYIPAFDVGNYSLRNASLKKIYSQIDSVIDVAIPAYWFFCLICLFLISIHMFFIVVLSKSPSTTSIKIIIKQDIETLNESIEQVREKPKKNKNVKMRFFVWLFSVFDLIFITISVLFYLPILRFRRLIENIIVAADKEMLITISKHIIDISYSYRGFAWVCFFLIPIHAIFIAILSWRSSKSRIDVKID